MNIPDIKTPHSGRELRELHGNLVQFLWTLENEYDKVTREVPATVANSPAHAWQHPDRVQGTLESAMAAFRQALREAAEASFVVSAEAARIGVPAELRW